MTSWNGQENLWRNPGSRTQTTNIDLIGAAILKCSAPATQKIRAMGQEALPYVVLSVFHFTVLKSDNFYLCSYELH